MSTSQNSEVVSQTWCFSLLLVFISAGQQKLQWTFKSQASCTSCRDFLAMSVSIALCCIPRLSQALKLCDISRFTGIFCISTSVVLCTNCKLKMCTQTIKEHHNSTTSLVVVTIQGTEDFCRTNGKNCISLSTYLVIKVQSHISAVFGALCLFHLPLCYWQPKGFVSRSLAPSRLHSPFSLSTRMTTTHSLRPMRMSLLMERIRRRDSSLRRIMPSMLLYSRRLT